MSELKFIQYASAILLDDELQTMMYGHLAKYDDKGTSGGAVYGCSYTILELQ